MRIMQESEEPVLANVVAATPRLAIVGLDGATFRILDPMIEAGAMPALADLRRRGVGGILRSTIPTYTPPAWVSMATGVNPGRHGIFGFLANTPQEPTQVAQSGFIKAPPMWGFLNDMGKRAGIFHVPMTWPPNNVQGFMVSGGLAAGWTDPQMRNFTSDDSVQDLVRRAGGQRYAVDTQVNYEKDWHSPAVVTSIRDVQRQRRNVLAALLEEFPVDVLFAVFEGPDRLMHVHYQYVVECSEWYGRREAQEIRDHTLRYFAELDAAIGDIVSWAGADGHVVVVSDHGFGPWEKTINVNLLLAQWGYLALPPVSRITGSRIVSGVGQRLARRVVPRRILHRLKAHVAMQIEWDRTRAFASHVAEQGVHINHNDDRFPMGVVPFGDVPAIEQDLIERFAALTDPDDRAPVVDRVVRRADTIHGPYESRSPDLFPMCRDQRYELSDTLAASSPFTDHRDRPWGYHHIDGVFIAAGPQAGDGTFEGGLDMVDVLPTTFHLAGLPVPAELDGHVVNEVLGAEARSRPVVPWQGETRYEPVSEQPLSPDEEAAIEESLRGLGYIE